MIFKNKDIREGKTIKFKGLQNIYITINKDEDQNIREVFINVCTSGTTLRGLCEALGRVISVAIQHDHRLISKIVKTLEGTISEVCFRNGKYGKVESIPDAIAKVLKDEK